MSIGLRVGSLFSGYGGLDIAVEQVFGTRTVWFSEISQPLAKVFSHHWPHATNLADVTRIDWHEVEPVEILCGGFPCQDVANIGNRRGMGSGTRSGLWAHMAEAVRILHPGVVVIENVRGLLSTPAHRRQEGGTDNGSNQQVSGAGGSVCDVGPGGGSVGGSQGGGLRAMGAVLADLADLGYDAQWYGLPASTIGAPHKRFRVFILAHHATAYSSGQRLAPFQGDPRTRERAAGNHQPDPPSLLPPPKPTPKGPKFWWGQYRQAIERWQYLTAQPAPYPVHDSGDGDFYVSPVFVEWMMGLPPGWVTNPEFGLSLPQQLTALGNGVVPAQARFALQALSRFLP